VTAKKKKEKKLFRFGSVAQAVTTILSIFGLLSVAFGVWFYFEDRFAPKDLTNEKIENLKDLTNEKISNLEKMQNKDAERLDFKIWCDREVENQKRIWEILDKYPPGTKNIPKIVVDELNARLLRKEKIVKILKYFEDKGFKMEGDD